MRSPRFFWQKNEKIPKMKFFFFFMQFIFLYYEFVCSQKNIFVWVWSSTRHTQHEICISIKFQNFTQSLNGTICVGNVPLWCKSFLKILFVAIWISYKLFLNFTLPGMDHYSKIYAVHCWSKNRWYFDIYLNKVKIGAKFKKMCDKIYYVPDVCQYF